MGYLDPLLPLVCGLMSGYAFSLWLSTVERKARLAFAATIILVAATIISICGMVGQLEFLVSIPLSGIAFLIGYTLMSSSLGREVSERQDQDEYGDVEGKRVVIYLGQGEPDRYSLLASRRVKREEELDGRRWSSLRRPFAFLRLRRGYGRLGRSDHRERHRMIAERLGERLEHSYPDHILLTAFHEDEPPFNEVMRKVVEAGPDRVIVARSYLVDIWGTERILGGLGESVRVTYMEPLWSSTRLKEAMVRRTTEMLEGMRGEIGIILIARIPENGRERVQEMREQEWVFLESLRDGLDGAGIRNVRIVDIGAGLWRACKEMAEGVRRIAYLYPFSLVGSIDDLFVKEAIRKAVGDDMEIISIETWTETEAVAQELADRIAPSLSGQVADQEGGFNRSG